MRCACGHEVNEGSQYCELCGRELFLSPASSPVMTAPPPNTLPVQAPNTYQSDLYPTQQYQPQQYQTPQYQSHKYQTLGGFLLVFVVFTFIGAPINLLSTAIGLPDDLYVIQSYVSMDAPAAAVFYGIYLVMALLQTVSELMLAILLLMRNRHIITMMALAVLTGVCGLIGLIAAYLLDPTLTLTAAYTLISIFVASSLIMLAVSVLLMVYFFKSVRVRTYMRSDAYITQGLWKFVKPPMPAVPDPPTPVA